MTYPTGEQPQVGDRVQIASWKGWVEATVERTWWDGWFVRADGVWNHAKFVTLVERPSFTEVFGDVLDRNLLAARKEELHAAAGDQVIQEVILNVVGPEGSDVKVVMNMGPGVNTVLLSGKVDPSTDLDAGDLLRLQMFDQLEVVIPNGFLPRDVDHGDEVMVTGHLEQIDHEGGKIVVVADQVVKL